MSVARPEDKKRARAPDRPEVVEFERAMFMARRIKCDELAVLRVIPMYPRYKRLAILACVERYTQTVAEIAARYIRRVKNDV